MKKQLFRLLVNLIIFSLIFVSGCAEAPNKLSQEANYSENSNFYTSTLEKDTLFQVSTIDALLKGVYDGALSFEELESHGDFGIGTFDKLDGEMIALDGIYYQIKSDGIAYPVPGESTTPFATVTYYETDTDLTLEKPMNLTDFEEYLDQKFPSENFFYAVRVEGNFSYLKARSVPEQEKPYPKLADAVSNQSIFEFENVSGTLVGFKTPEFAKGVNVPGYHLHFLTSDKKAGGHVLDFELENGTASFDTTNVFLMELPTEGNFSKIELGEDLQTEMETVEK